MWHQLLWHHFSKHQNDPNCDCTIQYVEAKLLQVYTTRNTECSNGCGTIKDSSTAILLRLFFFLGDILSCTDDSLQSLMPFLPTQLASHSKSYGSSNNFNIRLVPPIPLGIVICISGSFHEQFLQELCSHKNMTLFSSICTAILVTVIC